MKSGFLSLATHPKHPGLVLLRIQDTLPELTTGEDGSEIRYLARFADIDTALMHTHTAMRAALHDLERRIYRKPITEMIACVEAVNLKHSRVWIDPTLSPEELARIDRLTLQRKASRRRIDRIWQAVGLLGVLFLLLLSL